MQKILIAVLIVALNTAFAQTNSVTNEKQRLDFAKTYFELGATLFPSFTGAKLVDNEITTFENSASVNQYLTWGGYHFWGRAEFYVTIPLHQINFKKNNETDFQLIYSATTGARFFPWAYREKKIRPYVGLNWAALDFKQETKPNGNQPVLSKDFMLAYEGGIRYGYRDFSVRLGVNYFADNTWGYPIGKTVKTEIKTPPFAVQVGLTYAMDFTRKTDQKNIDAWNSFPPISKQALGASKFGDVFIGIGPSTSYSLFKSDYNLERLPYLKDKLTSTNYFDIAAGYHFYKAGLFTVLSFRNPKFETEGYGAKQTIRKTSFALEINKFLIDYSGFTPYLGLNIAYDKIHYSENAEGIERKLLFDKNIEPGITFGWDIRPGKNAEALILRTNLRWYPYSSFAVDGIQFNFSQLEYNLIQAVFYPDKLRKRKKPNR